MAPRSRDDGSDERRGQIVRAAARVFAEKGFRGATNRDIAAAAGISPGLIYWYFASKDDLFAAVFEEFAPLRAWQLPPEQADALPVEAFLERLAAGFLAIAARDENRALFRLVMSEVPRFPGPAERLGQILTRYPIGYLAGYVERQAAAGRLAPVDPWLLSQAFYGALLGYVIRKFVLGHADLATIDDATMAATVAGIFGRGLLPAGAAPAMEGGAHAGHPEHGHHAASGGQVDR
ncbi:MAG TPA: TetR/AcrR family transcriptional regulator [Thermomicrobiaceae bacterium]|nr:TetR/AcrR family transcriptional regulator [Thermomicrobiaceae bacterium]